MKGLLFVLLFACALVSCDSGKAESSESESKEHAVGIHYEEMAKHSNEFHQINGLMESNGEIIHEYWGDPTHDKTLDLANEEDRRLGRSIVKAYDAFQVAASEYLKAGGDPEIVKNFTEAIGPFSGAAYR